MAQDNRPKSKSAIFAVFFTIFLDLIGFGLFVPVLSLVARDFGATDAQAAGLSTIFSVGTVLSVALLGRLSDKVGRKPLLIATVAVSALTQLATGFATSFGFLLFMRFFAGVAAGNISVAQAVIADVTDEKDRAKNMVFIGLAFGFGFVLGPALGALISRLAGDFYFPAIGLTAFFLNVINLGLMSFRLRETHPQFLEKRIDDKSEDGSKNSWIQDFRTLLQNPILKIVCLVQFLHLFAFVGVETLLPFQLQDAYSFEKKQVFDVFIFIGVAVLFFQGIVARKLLAVVPESAALLSGEILLFLASLGLVFAAPSSLGLIGSLVLLCAGSSFVTPSLASLLSKSAPSRLKGFALGVGQTIGSMARIVGPATVGFAYQNNSSKAFFISATSVGAAALLVLLALLPKKAQ